MPIPAGGRLEKSALQIAERGVAELFLPIMLPHPAENPGDVNLFTVYRQPTVANRLVGDEYQASIWFLSAALYRLQASEFSALSS